MDLTGIHHLTAISANIQENYRFYTQISAELRQFGTNNLPDCSNMCHESSGTALTETIGIGKGTVTLEDFEKCDSLRRWHRSMKNVLGSCM